MLSASKKYIFTDGSRCTLLLRAALLQMSAGYYGVARYLAFVPIGWADGQSFGTKQTYRRPTSWRKEPSEHLGYRTISNDHALLWLIGTEAQYTRIRQWQWDTTTTAARICMGWVAYHESHRRHRRPGTTTTAMSRMPMCCDSRQQPTKISIESFIIVCSSNNKNANPNPIIITQNQ